MKGDRARVSLLDGDSSRPSDIAADTDNTWTDGAVVDAHAGVGFTYDYYFARSTGAASTTTTGRCATIIHPANRDDLALACRRGIVGDFLLNAFWCPVCGVPDNQGFMVFGEGLPPASCYDGQTCDFFAGRLRHRRARDTAMR